MITCPNCQKQLEDGTKFCDACGTQIIPTIFCPNCGNVTNAELANCQVCGAPLHAEPAPAAEPVEAAAPQAPAAKPAKKNSAGKLIAIAAAALAAVVLIAVILVIVLSGGKKNNYILYVKDKELFYSAVSKIKPIQITEDLLDGKDLDNSQIEREMDVLVYDVVMTKDGKKIFFGDEYQVDEDGDVTTFTLYYRPVGNTKKAPVKIDAGLSSYIVSEDGKTVTYMKDGSLYQHDLKDKKKISSDVSSYKVSTDGKTIIWIDNDSDMYLKKGNKDKKKLDSEVNSIYMVNEKFNAVWYSKNYDDESGEFDLFKHDTKDKKKLASDVSRAFNFNESGEFYYTKSEKTEKAYIDFVDKDTSDVEEYMMEQLEELTETIYTTSIFYYDGKGAKQLTTTAAGIEDYDGNDDANVVVFYEKEEVKVKLSEIESAYDVSNAIYDAERKYFVAIESTVHELAVEDAEDLYVTYEGDAIYYLAEMSELAEGKEDPDFVSTGTMYKVTLSGKKIKKTDKYAEDVYTFSVSEEGTVFHITDYKKSKTNEDGKTTPSSYTLFKDNKKVADDVNGYHYCEETGAVIYATDINTDSDKQTCTLNYFKGSKSKKIADDVYANGIVLTPKGEVLYLQDYNTEKSKGDLFLYNGSKSKKVDEDVVGIIQVVNWEDRWG